MDQQKKRPEANEEEIDRSETKQTQQPQQADEVQQTESIVPDYPAILREAVPVLRDNKDLLNFTYYLYKQRLQAISPSSDEKWLGLRQKVFFCNSAKMRPMDKGMDVSRLAQLYTTDVFGGEFYTTLWAPKERMTESLLNACENCRGYDGEALPFCPALLCYVIEKTAEDMGIDAEKLFDRMLGEDKIPFRGKIAYRLNMEIPEEDLRGIDAKSAHGAYMLMSGRMIKVRSIEEGAVSYTHLPLCRDDDKKSKIAEIMDFWKTGSGVYSTVVVTDKISLLHAKTEGCMQCSFEQCPHKLAAYFTWLGEKYGVEPIDLAYHVALGNTYGGITIGDNYQFNRFLSTVRTAPMREDSKAELIKMIHYIAGRKANYQIPFLPFNMVLTSPDIEKAGEIIGDFANMLWHFDYFRAGKENTGHRDVYISSVSVEELCNIYADAPAGTTLVLYDMPLLCENEKFKEQYHRLLKIMEDRRKDTISILVGDKADVTMFFAMYPQFRNNIFTKNIEMFDMDKGSVLKELITKLGETFTISELVEKRLEQYISVSYPTAALRGTAYVNELYEKLLFNHYNYDVRADSVLRVTDIPYIKPPRTEQEIFDELNRLTGLENVKEELRNINNLVRFNIKMGANSKNSVNMHMMFTGNPGTGKTTVAKLTAEILHNIGFIQEDKLVICSAKDLIAEYTGQTTIKTAKKCEMAYNGVLFIDEAYQLNPYTGHQADTFKEECIAELIQQMENNRDRLVVIFAGYTEEMMDFMNRANTGLRSRIGRIIPFPDYTAEELVDIFANIVRNSGLRMESGVSDRVYEIFKEAKKDAKRFGNARYARNLYERSLIQHAAITAYMDADDPALKILRSDEITLPNA